MLNQKRFIGFGKNETKRVNSLSLGEPHLLKGPQRCQNTSSYPDTVMTNLNTML